MFALSWASSTYSGVEFQECSTHARQDATVMCLNTEMMAKRQTSHGCTFERKREMIAHVLPYQEMFCRGKWVRLEPKPTVVSNVYKYFKEQSSKGGISINALRHTEKAAGLSQTTIIQIVGDKRRLQENEDFHTPTKTYCSSWKRILSDNFDQ